MIVGEMNQTSFVLHKIRIIWSLHINDAEKFLNNEKFYDKLSIMGKGESPAQWRLRVKSTLQYLLSRNEYSIYHRFCLFAGFGPDVVHYLRINFLYHVIKSVA